MGYSKVLEALFPGPKRLILTAVFGEPGRWWTMAELAGRAGMAPRSLRPYLAELLDGGIIREKSNNGASVYQPNHSCPVFVELQAVITKLTAESGSGETILVVEDQPATAQITRILLESWGYRVLEAHGGDEAIHVFELHDGDVDLLLTDVIMPGINGQRLALELLARNPELRVVFMSGYPEDGIVQHDTAFLAKPFNPNRLSKMIRKELDRARR